MTDAIFPEDWTNHEPEQAGDGGRVADCDVVVALIPAYSIGATDPEETALVQARLAQCPEAARALAEFSAFGDALLHTVTPVQPPAALGARLQRALTPGQVMPRLVAAHSQPTSWLRAWRWSTFWVAAGATTIALLLALNLYWIERNITLQGQYDALVNLQAQQQADWIDRNATLQRQYDDLIHMQMQQQSNENAAYVLLASDQRKSLDLPPAQEGSAANAEVLWDPELRTAMLYANKFPPLPADQVYQLWVVNQGERTSGGLFRVDDNGVGVLLFPISAPIDQLDALGVTTEPKGGSDGPTSPAVVRRRFTES